MNVMLPLRSIPLLLLAALPVLSATVTESFTCSTLGTSATLTAPNQCNVLFGTTFASAWIQQGTYIYPGGAEILVGSVLSVASTVEGNTSSGSASLTYLDSLVTTGASRPGFLVVSYGGIDSTSGDPSAAADGAFTLSENATALQTSTCNDVSCAGISGLIPITLGTGNIFTFNGWADVSASTGYNTQVTYAESNNQIYLFFYEADGTTLANVGDLNPSPEPATWGMLVAGLALIALKVSPKASQACAVR